MSIGQDGGSPAAALMRLLHGYRAAHALYLVARLDVADHLRDAAKSSDMLAAETGTDGPTLRRILRALTSLGVFTEDERGRFRLTPTGTLLRRDVPGSLRAGVLLLMDEQGQRAWGALQYSVQTGKSAFEHLFGMGPFDYYAAHPEAERSQVHDDAMAGFTALVTDAIVRAYDFSGARMVIDVGGGNGALLAAILRANRTICGTVYDLPHVIAGVAEVAGAAGVDDRCAVVAGSFFESVPEGGDVYILKRIIHDWDDERAGAILTACRRAMQPAARLLVVDEVLPRRADTADAAAAFLLDLEMLVMTSGGRERTEDEFRSLLAASGFTLARVVPVIRCLSIVEARTA